MNQKPLHVDSADRALKIPPVESPRHEEALLDQAVAETFPASDPISPAVEARVEAADARRNESFTKASERFSERVRRNAPALVAIGTAAFALMAMRALRSRRQRAYDSSYGDE